MNTIKFEPINQPKTETHNIEEYTIKKIDFKGKSYDIYSNVGFSIYVTNKCNANCNFCMNKYESNFLCTKEILDDEEYFQKLEFVLQYLKPLNPSILITGGEPTKSKRLTKVLRLIHKYNYKIRSFATNGSGLLDIVENKSVLQHMFENNILNNINISRHAISKEDNFQVMKNKDDLDEEQLIQVANFCKEHNMRERLSCTLQKSYINDLDQILKYISYYDEFGFNTTIFREMIPINKNNKAYKEYNEEFVDISDIFHEIEQNTDFEYLYKSEGLYYTIKFYKYKNKLVKCYKEKNTANPEIIRDLIFYSDGRLESAWDDSSKILLNNGGN